MVTTVIQIIAAAFILAFVASADADHKYNAPDVYNTYITEEYITNEYVTNATTEQYTDNYSYDKCQGVPLAMAVGNNQMYLGTKKPQASIGVGECGGQLAGSVMFGAKPCTNCPMINGNWAFDENDVNAFGLGATFVFK